MLIDAIVLTALVLAALHGFRRGALAPLLLLVATVVSVLSAPALGVVVAPLLAGLAPAAAPASVTALSTLAAGLLLYALMALGIGTGVRLIRSGGCLIRLFDGVVGLFFGMLRGLVLLGLAVWLLGWWAALPADAEEHAAARTLRAQAEASLVTRVTRGVVPDAATGVLADALRSRTPARSAEESTPTLHLADPDAEDERLRQENPTVR
ncbi:MAG: hypothetical protein EA398_09735 [Deltaproteobacteria bacterium]|nr:MAG: hypothetical protein EA398_09735 [Deltaproteobacteria bacterium]